MPAEARVIRAWVDFATRDSVLLSRTVIKAQTGALVKMSSAATDWKVRRVHLFVSAPTTAALLVGQKMQARHHADFICYEALPGASAAYQSTIEITAKLVRELVTGQALTHPLQH